ncbi:diguanylate cyclase [Methylotuvimicrobium sp. KM1]|uniref:diguanylate cyclase n=1 Tax=Methylotuvimicrobium sp. KM1 TaxID=3377707 RepID=UPI00384B1B92
MTTWTFTLMPFRTDYDYSTEENIQFMHRIVKLMMRNKITPTPINYAVFYEYTASYNDNLKAAVDQLIGENNPFDMETGLALYKKHICHAALVSFDKINHDIQRIINHTEKSVNETQQKASEASDSFEEKSIRLESITNLEELKTVLTEIAGETKGLIDTSDHFKSQLEAANQEMEQLRKELSKVKEAATVDALTGLLNRGTFDETLTNLLEESSDKDICLTLLDLDHFKQVNDKFGHLIGDNVLKFTASLLKKYSEKHHYVARYGGEELAIIMPNTSLSAAQDIAEKIRTSLQNSRLKRKNSNESIGTITLSIGIATRKQNDTIESFILRADQALYKAKETGRNKVICEWAIDAISHC